MSLDILLPMLPVHTALIPPPIGSREKETRRHEGMPPYGEGRDEGVEKQADGGPGKPRPLQRRT